MIRDLFGICLLATILMIWRSYKQWQAYNKAHVTRTQMVNQVFVTSALGAASVALGVISAL
jgi:hypothetical protein